ESFSPITFCARLKVGVLKLGYRLQRLLTVGRRQAARDSRFLNGFAVVCESKVRIAEFGMCQREFRIDFDSLLQLRDGLIILACTKAGVTAHSMDDRRQRIELLSFVGFLEGFLEPTYVRQILRVPLMGRRVVGIEGNGSAEFRFRSLEVPIVVSLDSC